MRYEVFDTGIIRLFGTYDTEEAAMTLVRALIAANGEKYAEDLALGCERDDGSFEDPWTGAALIARAEQVLAAKEQTEARRAGVVGSRQRRSSGADNDSPTKMAAEAYRFRPGKSRRSIRD